MFFALTHNPSKETPFFKAKAHVRRRSRKERFGEREIGSQTFQDIGFQRHRPQLFALLGVFRRENVELKLFSFSSSADSGFHWIQQVSSVKPKSYSQNVAAEARKQEVRNQQQITNVFLNSHQT